MNMDLNARQEELLELILRQGDVKLAELKHHFRVTEMTIRRDLEKLEQLGVAKRTFGGAIAVLRETTLQQRNTLHLHQKKAIGGAAIRLIQPGDCLFIDGGSTTLQLAKLLPAHSEITVVTNAVNVALELMGKGISVILTGGRLVESTSSMVGPLAAEAVSKMVFTRAFLGAAGLSVAHGFSNTNMDEAEIKRLAIRQAAEVNILLDSSKLDKSTFYSFAGTGQIHRLITDRISDPTLLEEYADTGMMILQAEEEARNDDGI